MTLRNSDEESEKPDVNGDSRRGHRDWSVKALVVEVISIVIGVLLALGLSEWSEERNHIAQAEIALGNIASEVRSNFKLLTAIHENNTATIQAMDDEPDAAGDEERNFIPGLQLRETAWETFLSTGLSNYANYDQVLVLSQMYAIQDIYKKTGMQLVEAFMTMSAYATVRETEVDNNHFQKQFAAYFELLSGVETQLLLSYESAIADFNNEN